MTTKITLTKTIAFIAICASSIFAQTYPIVGTGVTKFFNNTNEISEPSPGEIFYGQDAHYPGNLPSYTDNGDNTISDNVTALMWTKSADLNGDGVINVSDKISYSNAPGVADTVSIGGYNDWRVPTIKELYSLMDFRGLDPSGWTGTDISLLTPFIDDSYFDVGYGDADAGERIIDGQYVTTTKYVSTTMNGDETMFGLNLVDGRIKGYPTGPMMGQQEDKGYYAYFVRGNTEYGINKFSNNNDGTVTDSATHLMWMQADSDSAMKWQAALAWAELKNSESYLGHNDWRVPSIKELQSILDYTRSPATHGTAAIDPVFSCTEITVEDGVTKDFPFYWSNGTHENMTNGSNGNYMCFGSAYGWMYDQMQGGYNFWDVHGAGAQRSDPKDGNPDDYPNGHGPQGDVIRVYNYVRLVRDFDIETLISQESSHIQNKQIISQQGQSFKLNGFSKKPIAVQFFTVQGRMIQQELLQADVNSVNLPVGLSAGLYIIKAHNSFTNFTTSFVVK